MMKYKKIGALLCVLAAAALLMIGCAAEESAAVDALPEETGGEPAEDGENPEYTATDIFGDFTAQTLDGDTVTPTLFDQADLTMVNIWGTFCGPCIEEMPGLAALQEKYADQGFQIVGLLCDVLKRDGSEDEETVALARKIVQAAGAEYPNIIPDDKLAAALKGVDAVPTTLFFNKDGIFLGKVVGSSSLERWSDIVEGLLEEENQ